MQNLKICIQKTITENETAKVKPFLRDVTLHNLNQQKSDTLDATFSVVWQKRF